MDIIIIGMLLGGAYALMAMGLQLQYGVARIMNLANGEMLVAGSFAAFWIFTGYQYSPVLSIVIVAPLAFGANWLIYKIFMRPLVKRAKSEGQLEVDSILSTFGQSFILVGLMLALFGGEYFSYSYLEEPFEIMGEAYELNRIIAFLFSAVLCGSLYFWLNRTRLGLTFRAVSVNAEAAGLVGINVPRAAALAFGIGGAVTASGGALLSMFLTFDASVGVIFTMKALVIVIMGGVRDIRGTILIAFVLGLAETAVASLIDPGLTLAAAYFLFIIILLFRPEGLFGRRSV
ncbi:MAG: branched-chain amino acid ABC transporter permease [Rhodospirillaceae bacterium]|jgi:branched-chain amino acid transport system permease protein|nr:branched-chain amino acid ABC transporter permease [Rhodospirillaceae bacterium]MBT7956741.1 branched-chain amino acid ABC transporter permease [Rhodospirillaceae bacterium]